MKELSLTSGLSLVILLLIAGSSQAVNIQSQEVGYLWVDVFVDESTSFDIEDEDGQVWKFSYKGRKRVGTFTITNEEYDIDLRISFYIPTPKEDPNFPWARHDLGDIELNIEDKNIVIDYELHTGFRDWLRVKVSIT